MSASVEQQAGLSMVELLITLALSSFLILGLSQIYIDHKRTYVFQQSQLSNLENSRFAVLMLDELLGKAGYRRAPQQSMAAAFPAAAQLNRYCQPFAAGAVLVPLKSSVEAGQSGFCLRYQPAYQNEISCDGSGVPLAQNAVFQAPQAQEIVYVALVFKPHASEAQQGALNCVTARGSAQLLEGIADMRFEFAAGAPEHKGAAPFKTAEQWTALDGPVRAVRYAVLAASRAHQRDGDSGVYQQWYASASAAVQTRLAAQDQRQIYQLARGSQALRNMMP